MRSSSASWNKEWKPGTPGENWSGGHAKKISKVDLSEANLSEANLSEANLYEANLSGANLSGANLREARLLSSGLGRANLTKADLTKADLHGTNLTEANLHRANLRGAKLGRADLSGANLTDADLCESDLFEARLHGANLSGAILFGTNLWGVDLSGTNLSPLLNGANLSGANLSGANLSAGFLQNASLVGANLSGANLLATDLQGAYLREANLSGTNLTLASLRGANLSGADLSGANLTDADLSDANLTGCSIYGVSAWGVKLSPDTKQQGLIIRPRPSSRSELEITADDIEVAQFLYLLIDNEKLRKVIDTITSKVVLILGRFTPERKAVLDVLRDELRKRDYLPVIFDFQKSASRTVDETVMLLARMARFVIADLSDAKSILQELRGVVPDLPSVPVQPLILASQDEPGMFDFFSRFPWVLTTYRYATEEHLLANLDACVVAPAEAKARELQRPQRPAPV
jgi:uncharacterized protein YjbI with pentapeptide repeats